KAVVAGLLDIRTADARGPNADARAPGADASASEPNSDTLNVKRQQNGPERQQSVSGRWGSRPLSWELLTVLTLQTLHALSLREMFYCAGHASTLLAVMTLCTQGGGPVA